MAQTLQQIVAELNPTFNPQVKSLQQRASLIPGQIQTEEAGLRAQQEQAFGNILNGARRRGLGFSGIPISEQAQYTSTEFLPALARLRQSGTEQRMSLQDAINSIYERRDTLAQQIRNSQLDRDASARAASAAAAPTLAIQQQLAQSQERQAALNAEIERIRKELLANQNYKPGYSFNPQLGINVPNF